MSELAQVLIQPLADEQRSVTGGHYCFLRRVFSIKLERFFFKIITFSVCMYVGGVICRLVCSLCTRRPELSCSTSFYHVPLRQGLSQNLD